MSEHYAQIDIHQLFNGLTLVFQLTPDQLGPVRFTVTFIDSSLDESLLAQAARSRSDSFITPPSNSHVPLPMITGISGDFPEALPLLQSCSPITPITRQRVSVSPASSTTLPDSEGPHVCTSHCMTSDTRARMDHDVQPTTSSITSPSSLPHNPAEELTDEMCAELEEFQAEQRRLRSLEKSFRMSYGKRPGLGSRDAVPTSDDEELREQMRSVGWTLPVGGVTP